MTNQLLPLLELGASNKISRPSPERAVETKDQGFSRTFQDAEKKITSNKADAPATKDARAERQEPSTENSRAADNELDDNTKVSSANDKEVDAPSASKEAVTADNATDSANTSKSAQASNEDDLNKENSLSEDDTYTVVASFLSSDLSDLADTDLQPSLEGLIKQLQSLTEGVGEGNNGDAILNEGFSGEFNPEALQQLVDELFVDSSQVPMPAVADTIQQALSNQPLTIASAAQLINDLKKYAQLSPATENAGLKFSAALTPQAGLSALASNNFSNQANMLGAGLTGENTQTLTLQASTDITSSSISDKFIVDKLNFAQLLNSTAAGAESSSAKLSTDISPLQSISNVPLTTAAVGAKPQLAIGMPFQQAQWGEAVAERVMWMSSKGLQEADIHLNPSELGPIHVKVSIVAEQAHVSFIVSNASVREALDQNAIRLREMFHGEGLNLVDVDVSDQSQQQTSSSEENSDNRHFNGQNSESDELQPENQMSISSNGTSMLSLYA